MGKQGNLVQKFTQWALEGAEMITTTKSRYEKHAEEPQQSWNDKLWRNKKNSAQYDADLKCRGKKNPNRE